MTLKTKMSLLVFLTTVSIVSVGFSSWSITAESQAEIGGKIEVDNVVNNDDVIDYTIVSSLKFNEVGFIDSKGRISKQSEIIVDYTIDLTKCKTYLLNNSICSDVSIKYLSEQNTFNLFRNNTDGQFKNSFNVYYSLNNQESWLKYDTPLIDDYQCTTTFYFDNVLDKNYEEKYVGFSIKYCFEVDSGRYFYNNFYSVIGQENFEFLLSTSLTDYDYKNKIGGV